MGEEQYPQENPADMAKKYYITALLFLVNVVLFILYTFCGEIVYNVGSLNLEGVFSKHQYYRIVTCVFLHGGLEHLVYNMIMLVALGEMLERLAGHMRFAILYILSGMGASMFSLLFMAFSDRVYSSVGASGAIFGLIGALFVIVVLNNGRFGYISLRRIILSIALQLYAGIKTPFVDNAAHVGGLLCGVLVMLIMIKGVNRKRGDNF